MKRLLQMITLVVMLSGMIFTSCTFADNQTSKPIFDKLIRKENVRTFKIPAFVVRYVLFITEEDRSVYKALKGTTSFRVAIVDNVNDSKGIFERVNHELNENNYLNLADIQDKESKITIKLIEDNDIIREIVFLISDKDSFICFSMKGKISAESLSSILAEYYDKKSIEKRG